MDAGASAAWVFYAGGVCAEELAVSPEAEDIDIFT